MENNREHIDDFFKSALDGYTEAPPPMAWDALEKKLAAVPPKKAPAPYRAPAYFAILALLVFVGANMAREYTARNAAPETIVAANNNADDISANNQTGGTQVQTVMQEPANEQLDREQKKTDDNLNGNTDAVSGRPTPAGANNTTFGQKAATTMPSAHNVATGNNNRHTTSNPMKGGGAQYGNTTYNATPAGNGNQAAQEGDNGDGNYVINAGAKANGPADMSGTEANAQQAENAKKKDSLNKKLQTEQKEEIVAKQKRDFRLFEFGVKVGFERGFNNQAAQKVVAAPYVQTNITKRISAVVQPTVKYANLASRSVGGVQTYYKVNDDGVVRVRDSAKMYVNLGGSMIIDSFWIRNYTYSQTHDSIRKYHSIGGNYLELELPVLLKYKVTPALSVYGGVNMVYGKLISINEDTYNSGPIMRVDSIHTVGRITEPAPPVPLLTDKIKYTGNPLSTYSPAQYATPADYVFRAGYMVGITYDVTPRLMVDALLQQANVKSNVQAGYNVNSALSAPYFRFSLGYKLTK